MERKVENVTIKTIDGRMIDGGVLLYDKKRVSDVFRDKNSMFIVMINTIDDNGIRKDKIFINKEHIIWVKPKDINQTKNNQYLENVKYVKFSIKTKGDTIVDGEMNLTSIFGEEARNAEEYFTDVDNFPFIVMINAVDNFANHHHTIFINKKTIIEIEEII